MKTLSRLSLVGLLLPLTAVAAAATLALLEPGIVRAETSTVDDTTTLAWAQDGDAAVLTIPADAASVVRVDESADGLQARITITPAPAMPEVTGAAPYVKSVQSKAAGDNVTLTLAFQIACGYQHERATGTDTIRFVPQDRGLAIATTLAHKDVPSAKMIELRITRPTGERLNQAADAMTNAFAAQTSTPVRLGDVLSAAQTTTTKVLNTTAQATTIVIASVGELAREHETALKSFDQNLRLSQQEAVSQRLEQTSMRLTDALESRKVDVRGKDIVAAFEATEPVKPNLTQVAMRDAALYPLAPMPMAFGQDNDDSTIDPDTPADEDQNTAAQTGRQIDSPGEDAEGPGGGVKDANAPADADAAAQEEPLPPPRPRAQEAPPVDPALVEGANSALSRLRDLIQRESVPGAAASGAGGMAAESASAEVALPSRVVPAADENALDELVNIDFRAMDLANVVALLSHKAGINVIAGTELNGTVTANLRGVSLRQAIETALRLNNLGIVEENGIYRIVPYAEAMSNRRVTEMVTLENAEAEEVRGVLEDVLIGSPDENLVTVAANKTANVLVITAPENRMPGLLALAGQLDIAEPVLPTVTEAIKLNYADPDEMLELVKTMLTPQIGQAASDVRANHIVITDAPVVVEQVRELIKTLDTPTKQVSIEAMIVDAVLNDGAETGVEWTANAIRKLSRRGDPISNLDQLAFDTNLGLGQNPAGVLTFGVLSSRIDLNATIQAEVRNQNGKLLSNPVLTTVENKPANIVIAQEIPYVELVETGAGGSQTNTEFKDIGTTLTVTPKVTHENDIIVDIEAKESGTNGEFNGIPIEDKREVSTTLRVHDGQTIFIGGLRKDENDVTVTKVPVLGDIPVVNLMFRNNQREERVTELLIFMTCHVIPQDLPELTGYQKMKAEALDHEPLEPTAETDLWRETVRPEMRDPVWKFKRTL